MHHTSQHDKLEAQIPLCCTEANNKPGAAHQALFCLLQQFDGIPDHCQDIMGDLPLHWQPAEVLQGRWIIQ